MKSMNVPVIFLLIGIAIIALSQIVSRYFAVSDFELGAFLGVGIGMLLISIYKMAKMRAKRI